MDSRRNRRRSAGKPTATLIILIGLVLATVSAIPPLVPAAASNAVPQTSTGGGSAFVAVAPTRLLDTRNTGGGGPLGPGGTRDLVVADGTSVPTDATAVVMNVTTTNTTAASYLTVWPTGATMPLVSNLNWKAGETYPNQVVVPLGTGGSVSFFNAFGNADVVADLNGYFTAPSGSAGGEVGMTPARVWDSRAGSGSPGAGTTLGPGASVDVPVTGVGGVPATGVSAVILNITATNTTAPSFFTVSPTGTTRPVVSTSNWPAGVTRANRAYALVGTGGKVNVFNSAGNADLVVDVDGYFTDASKAGKFFIPVTPFRMADTRGSASTPGPNGTLTLGIGGVAGVPANASAAVLNITATNTTAPSYFTVYPSTVSRPVASDLNWVGGQTVPNSTTATLGTSGAIAVFNAFGSADVVADIFGYFYFAGGITITANPTSIAADGGTSKSTLTVTVTNPDGTPAAGDAVTIVASSSASGVCTGSISGPTNASGQYVAVLSSHTTAGTCTLTATEAARGQVATTTVTETRVPNTITTTATPNNIAAGGATTSNIVTIVTNPATGAQVADVVTYTLSGNPSGACGSLATPTATTGAGGTTPADVYTSGTGIGFCAITATEAGTGSTTTIQLTQHGTATNTTAVNANPTGPFPADGAKTSTITAVVSGNDTASDLVSFTMSGSAPGVCGTISPSSASTDATGAARSTYTVSTTAGTCTITATEAKGGSFNTVAIVTKYTVALTATPATIPGDGTSTSTLTAVVTKGVGAGVSGDTVTFALSGASCGTLTPTSGTATTDASGTATVTYTSSTTTGFCNVTATDASGGSAGPVTINQTSAAASAVSVVANPTTVPADNTSKSTVTAVVTSSGGGPVPNDHVTFTTSGGPCGTFILASSGTTNGAGKTSVTYQASITAGTCTITATDASGKSGSTTISQTAVGNTISTTATPSTLAAGGAATSDIVSTVTNSVTGPVVGDVVTYALLGNPTGACGTLATPTSTTGTGGVTPADKYTPSATQGFCTITASEAGTGSSTAIQLTQKGAATNNTTVAASPTGPFPADGNTTSTIKATVTGSAVGSDLVSYTMSGSGPGVCGTLTPASTPTDPTGVASVTYKVSTTAGTCTITATEANGGSSGSVSITQNVVPNNIQMQANPGSIKGDGVSTSVVTATVTRAATGTQVTGDTVNFSASGTNCGTLSAPSATTDASGQAIVTYTSRAAPSTSCVITATETGTGASTTVTITQTA